MSSFVINKSEYMKAAGVVIGAMAEAGRDDWWLYDRGLGRALSQEDMVEKFRWLYRENVKDVNEKYGEDSPGDDLPRNLEIVEGKTAWGKADRAGRGQIVSEMHEFFDSIRYQIEDNKRSEIVSAFLDKVLINLYKSLRLWKEEPDSWGELNIDREVA